MLAAMRPGPDPTSSSTSHRAGAAVSVLAHVMLVGAVLLLAEVHPFAEVPEQRIEVEVVTADEAPPPVPEKEPESKPVEQPTPNFEVSQTPTEQPKPQQQQPTPAAKPQPAETKPPAPAQQPPQQSAQAPAPQPQPQPALPQPAPQATAAPYPPAIPQEPDITVKYSVALGLPAEGGFDAPAETVANISADAVAALRKRLKACAALPAGLSPSDNVKIVIRVGLTPDGRLAQEPFLIEASASAKGPALMKGAIAALEACQPYTMLPADKYREWRILDIGFTPQDFRS
ncbi:hypothetical protein OOZ54_08660 [Rhodopseudomonas palustris]|uniref:hypothetical protein n=1 Tax=Rhodopseudomonas palustris TaxID=1076 RepID=UPI0022F1417A|nr:hypothetical protein [Rhodopseudomonas palustris]WBU32313.1 hypothetical protein OOZ54_08660 [Rhodopseudomonas palustris]